MTARGAPPAWIGSAAFVARCTGSAMLASLLAAAVGLGHPIWAVVSALVVSQDSATDTRRAFVWRVMATAIGLVVAIGVASAVHDPSPGHPLQLVVAIAICATVARIRPELRVCMWTAPIVLMTALPDRGIVHTAIERGSEVLLGAAVATVLHGLVDWSLRKRRGFRRTAF
ncbi:FUSC family protein [uncultured Sphingomonas sp.]|uniref:FUSC family protein n=1 Tax=uncultured Sphingomonas sp. TaxID=158754 RepID=UPI0025D87190|nr:FUSC family protein [uncultured Sphingomonas sp.]